MVSTSSTALAALLLLATTVPGGRSLVMNGVRVPSYIVRGHSGRLRCDFDDEGHEIYSVKWYKGAKEFFRYHPGAPEPLLTFQLQGFTVNRTKSTARELHLDKVQLEAAGWYKCEVTSGPPSFWTVEKSKHVHVIDLPDAVPFIRGHLESYGVGDVMKLNCSSYRSYPPVRLHWYVNEEPVSRVAWTSVETWTNPEPFSMTTTFSRLTHTVSPEDFNSGLMRVRCTASMNGTDYWESQEIAASRISRKQAYSEHQTSSSAAAPKTKSNLSFLQVLHVLFAVLALWLA